MDKKAVPAEKLEELGITEEELRRLGIDSCDYTLLRLLADDPEADPPARHMRNRRLERARRQHLARILNACLNRIRHLEEVNQHLRKDLTILAVAANAWFMNAEAQSTQLGLEIPVLWTQLVTNTSIAYEHVREQLGDEAMDAMRRAGEDLILGKEKT